MSGEEFEALESSGQDDDAGRVAGGLVGVVHNSAIQRVTSPKVGTWPGGAGLRRMPSLAASISAWSSSAVTGRSGCVRDSLASRS